MLEGKRRIAKTIAKGIYAQDRHVYSPQSGFEISHLNHLFPREELGEFLK